MARTAAMAALDATNRLVAMLLDQAEDETSGNADETKGETAGEE
jgi:hypothetical protein